MTIVVAVPDTAEGRRALETAVAEARLRSHDLVIVNLTTGPLDLSAVPGDMATTVVDQQPHLDVADLVLETVEEHPDTDMLIVGMRRRSPVGKAVLGSLSQRLLLDAAVPVMAVKAR